MDVWETLIYFGKIAGGICSILTLLALVIKPVREWLFGMESVREGQRCLLRAEIVRIYYRNLDSRTLREYEYKNLESCYAAYVKLHGNSFVTHIYKEMQTWDVIP